MPTYNVEVINESTGHFMNFTIESDLLDEDLVCSEVLSDLSVVAFREDD